MNSITDTILESRAISKEYSGTRALNKVDFSLRAEVHVLFGENGAGKSTLISILAGAQKPTSGHINFRGNDIQLTSVQDARRLGIRAVFQEFSLVPQMNVTENIFLGSEQTRNGFLCKAKQNRKAQDLLDSLKFNIDSHSQVATLTRAEQQMVEIAKALSEHPSVLILDEPTASLTENETNILFDIIKKLKENKVGIIYITHRMNEIRRIGDRVTILRDGEFVTTVDAKETSDDELVKFMTGRIISEIFPVLNFAPKSKMLTVESMTTKSVRDVSFYARSGEIVGFAGLVGSGKSDAVRACFGIDKINRGKITLNGKDITGMSPAKILEHGLFYTPSDRRKEGLVTVRSCRENISLSALETPQFSEWGFLRSRHEILKANQLAKKFHLSPLRIELPVEYFSGGNQQKIMLSKCRTREISTFIFDEPTVGVDVSTRSEIYHFIKDLCESGATIILVSSDLPEILNLSHRVYVFGHGQIQSELIGDNITESNLLENFFHQEVA